MLQHNIERCIRVVSNPVSYAGGTAFDSGPGCQLSWLRDFCQTFQKIAERTGTLNRHSRLPFIFFVIHYSHFYHLNYISHCGVSIERHFQHALLLCSSILFDPRNGCIDEVTFCLILLIVKSTYFLQYNMQAFTQTWRQNLIRDEVCRQVPAE